MTENEKLEEIFDRYVGLELLSPDWPRAPETVGVSDPSTGYVSSAVVEFLGEPLLLGVAGST